MSGKIEARLAELGVDLPHPAAPAASYVPFTLFGEIVYISGQLPMLEGRLAYTGILGEDCSEKDGVKAARLCTLHLVAQLREACGGDLDRVRRCLRLGGFVRSTAQFTRQPEVINGASELLVEIFGAVIGSHARSAVGVTALPRDAAVEIDAIFQIDVS